MNKKILNRTIQGELIDVTGLIPEVPACPEHGEALIPEFRTVRQGKQAGYWRCPISNKIYIIKAPL